MAKAKPAPDTKGKAQPEAGRSKMRLLIGATLLIAAGAGGYMYYTAEEPETPAQVQERMLTLLDDEGSVASWQQARETAHELFNLPYRDPDFAGATEFVLGIVAFRQGQAMSDSGRDRQFMKVEEMLKSAHEQGLAPDRLPEWSFAMGVTLHGLGKATQARRYLEQALVSFEPGFAETAFRLQEVYLDVQHRAELEQALELNDRLAGQSELSSELSDRNYLLRSQILMGLGRQDEATQALAAVSDKAAGNQGLTIFRAQALMADGRYNDAIELLTPLALTRGLNQIYPRQAAYLVGMCHERIGDTELSKTTPDNPVKPEIVYDEAILAYKRTAREYERSHEGLASNLRVADLLRRADRDEEAMKHYELALRSIERSEDFRNRWLRIEQFRDTVQNAWNQWERDGNFEEAIDLARKMPPLFEVAHASELVARANHRWAETLDTEYKEAAQADRPQLALNAQERWRRSGHAYAHLAEILRTTSRYADALRISAEHFRLGHDYDRALEQVDAFLETQPQEFLPWALVLKANIYHDRDQGGEPSDLDRAVTLYKQAIDEHPTSIAAFEARYSIGLCYVEQNKLDLAEKAWNSVLTSGRLTPAAREWQLSLFELGRLQSRRADLAYHKAEKLAISLKVADPGAVDIPDDLAALRDDAFGRWEESSELLSQYIERYPTTELTAEARFTLARALQHSARLPQSRLKSAETENARRELLRIRRNLLLASVDHFRELQRTLTARSDENRLDDLGRLMLRNSYFEIGHIFYELEEFETALTAYNSAANRYPLEPQTLLAHVQMANCSERLERPLDARSKLELAKMILEQMPDDVFRPDATNMTRQEWKQWLSWAATVHEAHQEKKAALRARNET